MKKETDPQLLVYRNLLYPGLPYPDKEDHSA